MVAGATLPMLARLVDKSLLHMSQGGCYGWHPLLSQYTLEKLAWHPEERAQNRTAVWTVLPAGSYGNWKRTYGR